MTTTRELASMPLSNGQSRYRAVVNITEEARQIHTSTVRYASVLVADGVGLVTKPDDLEEVAEGIRLWLEVERDRLRVLLECDEPSVDARCTHIEPVDDGGHKVGRAYYPAVH